MNRFARAVIEAVRLACARERLGDAPPAPRHPAPEREARRVLRLLFSIEPLGREEPAAPARGDRRWSRWLFAPEPLPREPATAAGRAPAPPRRPWLRWIFAPEPLALDPEPPPVRRRSRLAALFAPERLDGSP